MMAYVFSFNKEKQVKGQDGQEEGRDQGKMLTKKLKEEREINLKKRDSSSGRIVIKRKRRE